jgi:hypothetical protein
MWAACDSRHNIDELGKMTQVIIRSMGTTLRMPDRKSNMLHRIP